VLPFGFGWGGIVKFQPEFLWFAFGNIVIWKKIVANTEQGKRNKGLYLANVLLTSSRSVKADVKYIIHIKAVHVLPLHV